MDLFSLPLVVHPSVNNDPSNTHEQIDNLINFKDIGGSTFFRGKVDPPFPLNIKSIALILTCVKLMTDLDIKRFLEIVSSQLEITTLMKRTLINSYAQLCNVEKQPTVVTTVTKVKYDNNNMHYNYPNLMKLVGLEKEASVISFKVPNVLHGQYVWISGYAPNVKECLAFTFLVIKKVVQGWVVVDYVDNHGEGDIFFLDYCPERIQIPFVS